MASIFLQNWLFEKIVRSDGRHLRTIAFPLGLYENLTSDVCLMLKLFLFLFFILGSLQFFLLSSREFSIWFVALG